MKELVTKTRIISISLLCMLFGLYSPHLSACTTFSFTSANGPIVGKGFDWADGTGYVMINKRDVEKFALLLTRATPAKWTSKYASVTFNQFGRELPYGGMNETGLTVEIMWLEEAIYPDPADPRPALNESQWIQYQLDNFASVEELVANADRTKVLETAAKVHYLACDAMGECASFEYLDGELVIHQGPQLTAFTLTNNTAAESISYLTQFEGFGGNSPIPTGTDSLSRFVKASAMAKKVSGTGNVADAFEILESVRQRGNYSKWNIVYDVKNKEVYFKSELAPKVKKIRLGSFDYSCKDPVMVFDMNRPDIEGDISQEFIEYTPEITRSLVTHASNFLPKPLPERAIELVTRYPELTQCMVD